MTQWCVPVGFGGLGPALCSNSLREYKRTRGRSFQGIGAWAWGFRDNGSDADGPPYSQPFCPAALACRCDSGTKLGMAGFRGTAPLGGTWFRAHLEL